ncbi:MAG: hypothetical protein Q9M22_03230 [Mariprofundaceae bacterium]|nr:hypothetical protein [Mariprofundaceae bacterium]
MFFLILLCAVTAVLSANTAEATTLDAIERKYIGDLIYQHECGQDPKALTSWNKNEDFASLGIGHFIWYPAGVAHKSFNESFPALLTFVEKRGMISMPAWLRNIKGNPWLSRPMFYAAIKSPKMVQLRQWLEASRDEQVLFIKARLDAALPRMVADLDPVDADHVTRQYQRMVNTPMGYFALMDYVNFKGEGIYLSERYQGQGWGLQQVLLAMHGENTGRIAMLSFVTSSKQRLRERVRLAPKKRHEQRWLAGWENRLDHYLQEMDRFLK